MTFFFTLRPELCTANPKFDLLFPDCDRSVPLNKVQFLKKKKKKNGRKKVLAAYRMHPVSGTSTDKKLQTFRCVSDRIVALACLAWSIFLAIFRVKAKNLFKKKC